MSAFSSLSEFWQTMLPFIMLVEIVLEIGLFMYQLLRSNKPVRSLLSLAVMAVMKVGNKENLLRLYQELLNKDWFMTFPDFESYKKTREKAYEDYKDRMNWAKKTLINISKAGFFSSDRTIAQYNKDIWKLQ